MGVFIKRLKVNPFEEEMTEIRCRKCRRLLMKGAVAVVEIKCPKCGYIQTIEGGKEILNRKSQSAASVRMT